MRNPKLSRFARFTERRPGELSPRAKLTWEKVREIKRRIAAGDLDTTLAADYGVSRTAIEDIRQGRTWRDDPGAPA